MVRNPLMALRELVSFLKKWVEYCEEARRNALAEADSTKAKLAGAEHDKEFGRSVLVLWERYESAAAEYESVAAQLQLIVNAAEAKMPTGRDVRKREIAEFRLKVCFDLVQETVIQFGFKRMNTQRAFLLSVAGAEMKAIDPEFRTYIEDGMRAGSTQRLVALDHVMVTLGETIVALRRASKL